jgi:hypothetical protein
VFKENGLSITAEANLQTVDFLDITMDLTNSTFKPYMKPNNTPSYVHRDSNHPPSITKNIPLAVNKRLSLISSTEDIFNEAAITYQTALDKSGYRHKLKYEAINEDATKKKRCRKRRITWFNPPFSKNVVTNVARDFLTLIDSCFPCNHTLHSTFNRNTVKASYRTMPNMAQMLAKHNAKVLSTQQPQQPQVKACNCRKAEDCPLEGQCLTEGLVYQATVTASTTPPHLETYTGLTGNTFKTRYSGHISSFKNNDKQTATTLSQHIWSLKKTNTPHTITWKTLERGQGYNPASKSCRLCLLEKYNIMFKPEGATLNRRNELYSSCRHKAKILLANT